jgi:uncharacterized protein (DUF1330 family)
MQTDGNLEPTPEQFAAFLGARRSGPIHMLNLVGLREHARYEDGRQATGEEAYRAYAKESGEAFRRVGGKQHWIGRFELTFIGPANERWDRVFIAEYPSIDAFLAMLSDPTYQEAVKHRQAAVADSRLIRLEPTMPAAIFGE